MKPTILLTGGSGQIGAELSILLPALGDVLAPGRSELDLADCSAIRAIVQRVRPQVIINAAGFTAVDAAETHRSAAYELNATAPAALAEEARKVGALLVHYSTDYVFDGSKSSPYEESEATGPLSVYGETKLAGEQGVRSSGAHHLIFRTAWVYSVRRRNFLLTILRLATENPELRIVNDQRGSPTWSREIAAATVKILASILEGGRWEERFAEVTGMYHMTAAGQASWFDFAAAILDGAAQLPPDIPWFAQATSGKPLIANRLVPISRHDYRAPAARPAYSVLSNAVFFQRFGFSLSDWRTQLRLLFESSRETHPSSLASHS